MVPASLSWKVKFNQMTFPSPLFIKPLSSSHVIKKNTYFLKQSASWETGENRISRGLWGYQPCAAAGAFPQAGAATMSFFSRRAAAGPPGQEAEANTPREDKDPNFSGAAGRSHRGAQGEVEKPVLSPCIPGHS